MEGIINEYSQENITRSLGQRAEDLFEMGLMEIGFRVVQKQVKRFRKKEWKKSGHDLDFVFERDNIYYGGEVKNSLGYIEKAELDTKLQICSFFSVRPLFIMRMAPKTYINEINRKTGYALIFKYQLYELSQKPLVEKIKKELELPVDCPRGIYEGTLKRFENWHRRQINVKRKKIRKKE